MNSAPFFKVLNTCGTPFHGGRGVWSLPTAAGPGDWMPAIGILKPCESGYHFCRLDQLVEWLGPAIFEVEVRGAVLDAGDKMVSTQARLIRRTKWDAKTARLFAADCAEHVLHFFEAAYPLDLKPRMAVEVARAFVRGEATDSELAIARGAARETGWGTQVASARAVAEGAGWAAAYEATWEGPRVCSWAADPETEPVVPQATWEVAGEVARIAVTSALMAAPSAARVAERKWQTERLETYL